MSILSRLAALEAAQNANSGSASDVVALKGEVEALSAKVDGAASQADVAAMGDRVGKIEAEIGTDAPADPAPEPQA